MEHDIKKPVLYDLYADSTNCNEYIWVLMDKHWQTDYDIYIKHKKNRMVNTTLKVGIVGGETLP